MKNRKQNQRPGAHPTPAPSAVAVRDHPHPTSTLVEGGHKPGAGVGWEDGLELKQYKLGGGDMNTKEEEEVINTESITERKSDDALAKIAISKEADRALTDMVARVNDGFDAGKATKFEVTSHIILRFFKQFTETDLHDIRSLFFDPILLLETNLRKAKDTGDLPLPLRELLYQQFVATQGPQPAAKKSKKPLQLNIIKDNVLKDKGAA